VPTVRRLGSYSANGQAISISALKMFALLYGKTAAALFAKAAALQHEVSYGYRSACAVHLRPHIEQMHVMLRTLDGASIIMSLRACAPTLI